MGGGARTFIFADLAGYTALTEVHGNHRAAEIAQAFCARVCSIEEEHGARDVKTVGDAVMAHASAADEAILLGLRTVEELQEPGLPAVRVGMHHGPAMQRGADWFGAAVNLAAPVAELASPHDVLLTDDTARAAGPLADVTLVDLGDHELRNISEPVHVLRAARRGAPGPLPVDPVCQMIVDPAAAPAAVRTTDDVAWFCSTECFKRFKRHPERFARAPTRP